jgi:hypothetical protein
MESITNFLDKYGRDTTTNFYLREITKDLGIKVSIIMRDEIQNYKNKDNLIINLQTTNEQGSHWICCSKKYKIYFDSYGIVPIKEIEKYFKDDYANPRFAGDDNIDHIYNTMEVQKINTKICGQLCCFVLNSLEKGEKFEEIVLNLKIF